MPKFAANLSFLFQDINFFERFAASAECGFEAVEYLFPYDYAPEKIKQALTANGLTQALFNLPPGDWDAGERGLAALPGREAEFRGAVAQAGDYAEALGCAQVHAMAGIVPEGADPAPYEEIYVANLKYAADYFAARGIRTLIEPLNSFDMPNYLLNGTKQARRIIEAVGSDNLYLQYDAYHLQIMEGNLAHSFERDLDIISHVQIAGVPGRFEPSVGEINYPYLFALFDRLGYDGWIGCEYRPAGETRAGFGWASEYGIRAG
ncbi:MAG: hydroxypyruvate isomerase family protein [Rhodospirillaceae bacterium]|jgi:2-dehydrotetronate isomerase|nr:hydroxypyruvate isomerase family protein [Rhodospirillaceae bacterium]MBT4427885.1 hydroxypyruvate isomerase family protein [Rhodospirillaceae bacterium]MBT5038552.1 hydroxypyruvate isomerase family protein [Rhodospirillaceae bacterium]MBT7294221.1 hydroxypyruvate isomerase family protein [Rhodospirillaceae bacterium]